MNKITKAFNMNLEKKWNFKKSQPLDPLISFYNH